jgi:hypothetical protein
LPTHLHDRTIAAIGPSEVLDDLVLDAVKGISPRGSSYQNDIRGSSNYFGLQNTLAHPLHPGGMPEIGVPLKEARYVEENVRMQVGYRVSLAATTAIEFRRRPNSKSSLSRGLS